MYNYFYNTGASSREGQIPRTPTPQQRFTQRSCVRTTGIIYRIAGYFREKLEEAPRIKFRGFKSRGAMVYFRSRMT